MSLWHGSSDSGTPPARLYNTPNEKKATWPTEAPVKENIYGLLEDLLRTATFVQGTGVHVWAFDEEEVRKKYVRSTYTTVSTTKNNDDDDNNNNNNMSTTTRHHL